MATPPPLPTKITLEIVTPDRSIVNEQVDEIQLPGSEGYFGVLPGHTPLLATLQVGELWYRSGQDKHYLAVAFGFVEVLPDRVTVLAQIAERAEEIDISRAEAAKQRAEQRVSSAQGQAQAQVDMDFERARIALMKSLMRLQVAARARTRA
jgi:F-type H+-transporting ATPase subunit epsilon